MPKQNIEIKPLIFILGVIAVSRTVVSQLSTEDELTKTLSHLTMYQDLGFFIGPGKVIFLFH